MNTTRQITSTNRKAVGILLCSVSLGAIGQLTLKAAVRSTPIELTLQSMIGLATNPLLLFALLIYGFSALFWLVALLRADLSFAYPFLSLTYVAVLLGGAILFDERITPLRVIGFIVIVVGLLVVTRSENTQQGSAR